MSIRIYKKVVEIKGLKRPYEKVCKFNVKNQLFTITYPRNKYVDNIIEEGEADGKTLEEAEKYWQQHVDLFEAQGTSSTEVILYKYEPSWDYKNGAGVGFVFMWGIFKKVEIRGKNQYFYLRGGVNSHGDHVDEIWHGPEIHSRDKEWKEIKNTAEREAFFETVLKGMESMNEKLINFFSTSTFEDLPKQLIFL